MSTGASEGRGAAVKLIDESITTLDGFTFTVVDLTESEYIVRAHADGSDAAFDTGECDVDWEYVYIPFTEAH